MKLAPRHVLPVFYSPVYTLPLPPKHRFPMERYRAVHDGLSRRPNLLSASKIFDADFDIFSPGVEMPPGEKVRNQLAIRALGLSHGNKYIGRLVKGQLTPKEQRDIGFPWSPQLVRRTAAITGATVRTVEIVLESLEKTLSNPETQEDRLARHAGDGELRRRIQTSVGCNLAGGTHHAFRDHGEGFCLVNDLAVAAHYAMLRGINVRGKKLPIERVLIVDLDVHQGNGTAAIFRGDDRVFTFSAHGQHNYPFEKEKSDMDVELADNCSDSQYVETVEGPLREAFGLFRPQLVLFQAGVDPLAEDRLGRMKMTRLGLQTRNRMVFEMCRHFSSFSLFPALPPVGLLPVVTTMGGGYGKPLQPSIEAHVDVLQAALDYMFSESGI